MRRCCAVPRPRVVVTRRWHGRIRYTLPVAGARGAFFRDGDAGEDDAPTPVSDGDIAAAIAAGIRHGPVALRELSTRLDEDILEAVSARHGGVKAFVAKRPQLFSVGTARDDGSTLLVRLVPGAEQGPP